ncbi:MAG: E3 ubiquitin protein ligase [Longispora sp.]|nr:E3 ubiquitin protein ligase [Longispora sp. (in: high G+C Gram-positive bacteria)]
MKRPYSELSTILKSGPECPICLENFFQQLHDGEDVAALEGPNCIHIFHPDCIEGHVSSIGFVTYDDRTSSYRAITCPMCQDNWLSQPQVVAIYRKEDRKPTLDDIEFKDHTPILVDSYVRATAEIVGSEEPETKVESSTEELDIGWVVDGVESEPELLDRPAEIIEQLREGAEGNSEQLSNAVRSLTKALSERRTIKASQGQIEALLAELERVDPLAAARVRALGGDQ